jgi:hypothetical protein
MNRTCFPGWLAVAAATAMLACTTSSTRAGTAGEFVAVDELDQALAERACLAAGQTLVRLQPGDGLAAHEAVGVDSCPSRSEQVR